MSDIERRIEKVESEIKAIYEGLVAILGRLNEIQEGWEQSGKQLPPSEEPYNKLPWRDRVGKKGPFQMVTARGTGNSDLYRHLFSIVKVNTVDVGKFAYGIGAHYYWVGQDAIFRRPKKRKGANP